MPPVRTGGGDKATVATAMPVNGPDVPRLRPAEPGTAVEYRVVLLSFSDAVSVTVAPPTGMVAVVLYCRLSSTPATCALVTPLLNVMLSVPPDWVKLPIAMLLRVTVLPDSFKLVPSPL